MTQHPSLRSGDKNKAHRSVLKRYERIKSLKEKEKWDEDDSVFGLPKVKILRFKIKKEKAVAATEGAEATAPGATPAPAGAEAGKAAPQAKQPAGKEAAKPQAQEPKKEQKK